MKLFKDKLKLENLILLFYIIFAFVLLIYHEPWRDEAQSWLIARDLGVVDIFKQMRYEGHPCLWHLILVPFAKLGFPYGTVNIISWMFGCLSSIIIVKKSSFNKYVEFLMLFSPIFLYYCGVLGRSYSLCLFLVLLLSLVYNDKENKPIIYGIILFLCANTHVLLLGFIGSIVLIDIYDLIIKKSEYNRKNRLIGLAISISGLIVVFLQLFGSIGLNNQVSGNVFRAVMSNYSELFNLLFLKWGGIVNIIFIFLALYYMVKEKKLLFIFAISILFQVFVFIFIYEASNYMISLFYIIFIFCCLVFLDMIDKVDKNYKRINVCILLVFITFIPLCFDLVVKEFKYLNSDSFEVSKFIEENIDSNNNILCTSDYMCSSIIPYLSLEYKFTNVFTSDYFTYTNWGVNCLESIDLTFSIFDNDIDYIIYSYGINSNFDIQISDLKNNGYLEVVYKTNSDVLTNEKYEILRVNKS